MFPHFLLISVFGRGFQLADLGASTILFFSGVVKIYRPAEQLGLASLCWWLKEFGRGHFRSAWKHFD